MSVTAGRMSIVVQHAHNSVRRSDATGSTDGDLLAAFRERREEAAFEVLVRRHGPMVMGVCRRVLPNSHDAEDAFQATFLVLAKKAASIASPELLANWLHGVAHNTALRARTMIMRRRARETQVAEMPEPEAAEQDLWNDLPLVLDEELSRLPEKYRVPIVLCDLEGRTRREVAEQLGCPDGTVAARLARGRVMLARRLGRRGVALSAGVLAAVLSRAATACVPPALRLSTTRAATLLAKGEAATGVVSVQVAVLTEGVVKAMVISKLKAAVVVVLMLGFLATGGTLLTHRTAAGQDEQKPTPEKPVEPAAKQEKKPLEGAKREKRVYTPEELIQEANSLKPDEKVTVQFKVRLVQPSPQGAGRGADDLGLYPYDRLDWTQKQFTAILNARAKQQLKRLGVDDSSKHFAGKSLRVTGRMTSYLPFTDDPVSERQYELIIDDLSQIEVVERAAEKE